MPPSTDVQSLGQLDLVVDQRGQLADRVAAQLGRGFARRGHSLVVAGTGTEV
jgi:hypothetical protein